MVACKNGHLNIVRMLLERQADIGVSTEVIQNVNYIAWTYEIPLSAVLFEVYNMHSTRTTQSILSSIVLVVLHLN